MKEYEYHLFLMHPDTKHSIVQTITVDNEGFLSATALFEKLNRNSELFTPGYTLIGLNVGLVKDVPTHAYS